LFTLRQLGESDFQGLIAFARSLSFAALYFRFEDYDPGQKKALQACTLIPPEQGVRLIVVRSQDGGIS